MVETRQAYSLRQFKDAVNSSKQAIINAIADGRIKAEKFDTFWVIPKNQVPVFKSKKRRYPSKIKRSK